MKLDRWTKKFLDLADHISTWSKDPSTKVGAVIVGPSREVVSVGYNGFPRDVEEDHDERHNRPEKYLWTEHAERNAIYNAARIGASTLNCFMYVNWFPCCDCARGIIQSGIAKVTVKGVNMDHPTYKDQFKKSMQMLMESGVRVKVVED